MVSHNFLHLAFSYCGTTSKSDHVFVHHSFNSCLWWLHRPRDLLHFPPPFKAKEVYCCPHYLSFKTKLPVSQKKEMKKKSPFTLWFLTVAQWHSLFILQGQSCPLAFCHKHHLILSNRHPGFVASHQWTHYFSVTLYILPMDLLPVWFLTSV